MADANDIFRHALSKLRLEGIVSELRSIAPTALAGRNLPGRSVFRVTSRCTLPMCG